MNILNEFEIQKIMSINDEYEKALYLVSIVFKNIKDKSGLPYINHLIRVSMSVNNKNTKIAALLHDIVEDIDGVTFNDLKKLGFNDEVISLVRLVTNDKYEKEYSEEEKKDLYHQKISSILDSGNLEAIKLKYADMSDNFNPSRLKKLDDLTKERLYNKYKDEIIRLEEYINTEGEK